MQVLRQIFCSQSLEHDLGKYEAQAAGRERVTSRKMVESWQQRHRELNREWMEVSKLISQNMNKASNWQIVAHL